MKKHIVITNIVMTILTFTFFLFFRPVCVQGNSMNPTLKNGDTLICNTLKEPQVGDIVVIKPTFLTQGKYIIKRITDIKDNKFFVMGDNRNNSFDSRNFGCIPKDEVLGVVLY